MTANKINPRIQITKQGTIGMSKYCLLISLYDISLPITLCISDDKRDTIEQGIKILETMVQSLRKELENADNTSRI